MGAKRKGYILFNFLGCFRPSRDVWIHSVMTESGKVRLHVEGTRNQKGSREEKQGEDTQRESVFNPISVGEGEHPFSYNYSPNS